MNESTLQGISKLVTAVMNWLIKRYTQGKESSKRSLNVWKNNLIKRKNDRARRATMLDSVDKLLDEEPTTSVGKRVASAPVSNGTTKPKVL